MTGEKKRKEGKEGRCEGRKKAGEKRGKQGGRSRLTCVVGVLKGFLTALRTILVYQLESSIKE